MLLEAGVRIFLYPAPFILHAKHLSIDDDIAVLGFNRYLVDPSQAAPEDLVTEVCVPLA